jgi:hypothetical protein
MSTLPQPIMSGSPGGEPVTNPAQPQLRQPGGFFSKIGAFLKTAAPYFQPIADRLAAAAGNYQPMELERQQREDALRQSLTQSQLQNQSLTRQLTQKQIDNYQTPEQQSQTALNLRRQETPSQYVSAGGQVGVADYDPTMNAGKGGYAPRQVTEANPDLAAQQSSLANFRRDNPDVAGGFAAPPPPMPPTVTHPMMMPQNVGFHISGYDANGNPTVAEYSKSGAPMGNAAAPTPANVAVPTSPWKTYLETGRKQGLPDADIVNRWNTQESQRNNIKLVPQPDGTIQAVPVTEGSVSSRGALGSGNASSPAATATPRAGVTGAGRTVGGHAPKPVTDAFSTYNQSAERLNVMSDALPDALAGDQQAMLNLLSNHLGMTMGLQKGARMNQALIEEAMKSTPWLQGMQAKFDGRGYLSGVTLTPQQMQSMVKLAQDRANQDYQAYQRVQGEAQKGFGMNGTPPPAGPIVNPKMPPQNASEYLKSIQQ